MTHPSTCWLKPTLVELSEPSEKRKAISRSASTTIRAKATRSSLPSSSEDRYTELFLALTERPPLFASALLTRFVSPKSKLHFTM